MFAFLEQSPHTARGNGGQLTRIYCRTLSIRLPPDAVQDLLGRVPSHLDFLDLQGLHAIVVFCRLALGTACDGELMFLGLRHADRAGL